MSSRARTGMLKIFLICLWGILLRGAVCSATEIEVVYSFRALDEGWQEPAFEEGTILATITSSQPVTLRDPDETFVQLGSRRFTRIFHWAETDTVFVVFVDESEEEIPFQLFPAPRYAFDPAGSTVPVVHLQTEPVSLWDVDTGIYVYGMHVNWSLYGLEWERQATFEYWDSHGTLQVSEPVGIRINGGNSRSYKQKSFRIYFDHDDGPEHLTHDFFGNGSEDFARLLMRSGMYPHRLMFDTWANSLYTDLGHETSRIKFVSLFLNREYWGCYNLRERLDDEWLEITRGLDKDHFILIKDGETDNGNGQLWWDFLEWAGSPQDYSSHEFFEGVSRELNLASYIDWLIINIFGASTDNGFYANLALMKVENEPWEFVMWDEDSLIQDENAEANMFRFYSSDNQIDFSVWHPVNYHIWDFEIAAPFFKFFNHLMQNAQFRTRFSHRFDELMLGAMKPRSLIERLQNIAYEQTPALSWHAEKFWDGTLTSYTTVLDDALEWIPTRSILVKQQKAEFMQLFMAPVELSEFSAQEVPDGHLLQWRTEAETDCLGFVVQQASHAGGPFFTLANYQTEPSLVATGDQETPADYSFLVLDPGSSDGVYYRLAHAVPGGEEVVHPWIELVGTPPFESPILFINEFLALNSTGITDENGEYEDWVEIYNPGQEVVDLGGMFLTDDLNLDSRWQFSAGTTLGPGQYLIVWCDSDEEDGPLHASFKLSGSGEQCGLFSSAANGHELIDSVVFGVQTEDVSQGRVCDACPEWIFAIQPTPGYSNNIASAASFSTLPELPKLKVFPNPFNPVVNVEFEMQAGCSFEVGIYDSAGRLVKTFAVDHSRSGAQSLQWDGCDDGGHLLPTGVYFVRLRGDSGTAVRKITLVK